MSEEKIEAIQTRWSLIRNAHLEDRKDSSSEARRILVLRYAPAIRRYLGGIVRDDETANELAQDVMIRLMRGDFAGANPDRGRFRDFLKMALRNMVRSSWQKSNKRKTVDAELDLIGSDESEQDEQWTAQWRNSVLDNTWNRLMNEEGGKPSSGFHALKLRVEFPDANSEELADMLGRKVGTSIRPDNLRQILKRARTRFVGHLFDEVRAGLDSESEERLQEELAALGLLELVRDFLPQDE